jgi:hypothetical protein
VNDTLDGAIGTLAKIFAEVELGEVDREGLAVGKVDAVCAQGCFGEAKSTRWITINEQRKKEKRRMR